MKERVILLLAALPAGLSSETSKPHRRNTVDRSCGRVTDSEYTSTPRSTSYLLDPGRVKKAGVRRYRLEGKKCCAQTALLSGMPAGNDSGFEFNDIVPGEHCVVVVAGKKKYKLSVRLLTSAGKESRQCRDFVFQMRDDELRVLKMYKAYRLEENAETH